MNGTSCHGDGVHADEPRDTAWYGLVGVLACRTVLLEDLTWHERLLAPCCYCRCRAGRRCTAAAASKLLPELAFGVRAEAEHAAIGLRGYD